MKLFRPLFLILLLFAPPARADAPLRVVASFSILADMTKQIGGDDVAVLSLVGPNIDTHSYQPTPQDAKNVANAQLIIINGLGFEGWMSRLVGSSASHAPVVVASQGVTVRRADGAFEKGIDPHAWQDLGNGRIYAANIAAALERALPAKAYAISARAARYDAALADMDRDVRKQFADIPAAKRKIITSHDAFGYFGAAYGVTFLAPVGIDTDAEPSAAGIAALIKQIKTEGIRDLFIENLSSPRLIEQIERDTGAGFGGTLYSDALSTADGPAPTYLDMFRNNVPKLRMAMLANRG